MIDIELLLDPMGKKTFVDCFDARQNSSVDLDQQQVADLCRPDSLDWKPSTLATKTSGLNRVFRENRQREALRTCCEAAGLSNETRQKARQLYETIENSRMFPDEIEGDSQIIEGAKKRVVVNQYERNPVARKQCIEAHGCKCAVCGFDFEREYGVIGKGFIHVHHIEELSEIGEAYKVDPVNDLRPVCPNCHAMLHHMARPARSIDKLKDIIAESKSRTTRR